MGGHLSHQIPTKTEVLGATCGPVIGNAYQQKDSRFVDGYLGIPYAKPPVGQLRFKKPVEHENWTDTRDCTKYGPRSIQDDVFPGAGKIPHVAEQDEAGCLNLNVFAPRWKSDQWKNGFPVMVWIHGGGFVIAASCDYDAPSLAASLPPKDVVVVTINYRLGVLGFFSTGDSECSGNLGLWDQTLALQWVRKHIASFGGDPNNVTVFGQSAGGASTDFLSLSPHSRDLFHRSILMGGSAECSFAQKTPEELGNISKEFGKFLGWNGEDSASLMQFMKQQPAESLEFGLGPKKGFNVDCPSHLYFIPIFDGDFFPKPIAELRKEASQKTFMAGSAQHEGLFFSVFGNGSSIEETFKKNIGINVREKDFGSDSEKIKAEIFDFYTKDIDKNDQDALTRRLVAFSGDVGIHLGLQSSAHQMSSLGHPVYLYEFDYFNPDGFGAFGHVFPFIGATHCSELRYVLGEGVFSKFEPNDTDLNMLDITTDYFANFAKFGNPNQPGSEQWKPFSLSSPYKYFRIDYPKSEMTDDFQEGRFEFWANINKRKHKL